MHVSLDLMLIVTIFNNMQYPRHQSRAEDVYQDFINVTFDKGTTAVFMIHANLTMYFLHRLVVTVAVNPGLFSPRKINLSICIWILHSCRMFKCQTSLKDIRSTALPYDYCGISKINIDTNGRFSIVYYNYVP